MAQYKNRYLKKERIEIDEDEMKPLRHTLDLLVNRMLTNSEEHSLVIALANAIRDVLNKGNGAFFIHSEKEKDI